MVLGWPTHHIMMQRTNPSERASTTRTVRDLSSSMDYHHHNVLAPSASNSRDALRSSTKTISHPADNRSSATPGSSHLLASLDDTPSSFPNIRNLVSASPASTSSYLWESPKYGSIPPCYGIRETQPTSSTDAAPLTVQGQIKLCRRLQRTVTSMRDAILETRTRLDMEQKKSDNYRRFVHESLTKLIDAQGEARDAGTLETSFEAISELRTGFENDNANLQTQDAITKEVQSDLSGNEYHLMAEEERLVGSLATLCSFLGFDVDEAQSEPNASSEPADVPSGSQHPLALEYYDRKGEVQILKERLQDLDFEHREEQDMRVLLLDQLQLDSEREIEETESEFRRRFEGKRHLILTEIVAAENDTDRLEKECKEAGVELESGSASHVDAESVPEVEAVVDDQPKVIYVVPARPSRFLAPNFAAPSTLLTARVQSESMDERLKMRPTQNRRHIRQWLDAVASVPDYIMPETELGLEDSIVQEDTISMVEDSRLASQDANQGSKHESLPAVLPRPEPKERRHEQAFSHTSGSSGDVNDGSRWREVETFVDPLGMTTERKLS